MSNLNIEMLALAGLSILIFVGLFVFFGRRYRLAPQPASVTPIARVQRKAAPVYMPWRLVDRTLINAGSERHAAYRLRLEPEGRLPHWLAGATVQIYPGPAEGTLDLTRIVRDYPISSIPSEGAIELIVRDERDANSNWLCVGLQPGRRAAVAIDYDAHQALPSDETPLIVIGNGIGIGGLRAYIKARPPGTRNWLIFGEHSSSHDALLGGEIADWIATGHLERCDLVFSRSGLAKRHVSDQIRDDAEPLFDWVLADAAIYVCGRQAGFAADVEKALADVLGADVLAALDSAGLYRQHTY